MLHCLGSHDHLSLTQLETKHLLLMQRLLLMTRLCLQCAHVGLYCLLLLLLLLTAVALPLQGPHLLLLQQVIVATVLCH
jgi:hypothetical protein